jgi:hypothetical protein
VRLEKLIAKCLIKLGTRLSEQNYDRERSALLEHCAGGVRIYGDTTFSAQVADAISQLKRAYPYGYSLVQRYIRAIIQSNTRRGKGVLIGVTYQKCTPEGGLPVTADRYAANLVRQAVASRTFLGFQIWRSPRSELHSLNRELQAMRLLHCDSKYFHRVVNLILERERQLKSNRHGSKRHFKDESV